MNENLERMTMSMEYTQSFCTESQDHAILYIMNDEHTQISHTNS